MSIFHEYWHWTLSAVSLALTLAASVHVVLTKRDSRSAIGWIGVIWIGPFLGVLLYFLLGINRVHRKARRLKHRPLLPVAPLGNPDHPAVAESPHPPQAFHLDPLVRLVGAVTHQPLSYGNRLQPLFNGDEAYPRMLRAIRESKKSICLCTYIFKPDSAGLEFVEALKQARARNVDVRVIIDDIGGHYGFRSVRSLLRRAKIPVVCFLPKFIPRFFEYSNLCTHRKLLIVDGRLGFAGGMNISADNLLAQPTKDSVQDLHFQVEGPIVERLHEVFAEDWEFCTGETLDDNLWPTELQEAGETVARGITSGPDEDLERILQVCLGALSCAKERVRIVTPYFLPDSALVAALGTAVLRGVQVDILLPRKNNLRLVQWASQAQMAPVLEFGCNVWLAPLPFQHTKLMLVDGVWTLLGSANWDTRSLRLNFEFDIECYDPVFTTRLEKFVDERIAKAKALTLEQIHARPFPIKLRDGVARLLTPYL